jgi:general secretion pathway protein K
MDQSDHNNSANDRASPQCWRLNRGLALLSVLWILTLLALMAANFTRTTRTEINLTRNLLEQTKAEALADSGVYWAAAKLSEPAEDGGWTIDRNVHSLQLEEGDVRVLVADEDGKIDLNAGSRDLFEALFRLLEEGLDESAALADAIVDFRDPDSLRQLNGAEDDDYAEAELTHDAKDAPFEDIAELQQVLGMSAQLYKLVAPSLTVHTQRRTPNRATAPPLVAAALAGKTLDGSRKDDSESLEAQAIGDAVPDDGDEPAVSGLRSRLDLYAIHVEGRTTSGAIFARYAVLRVTEDPDTPFELLDWRQAKRTLFTEEDVEDD